MKRPIAISLSPNTEKDDVLLSLMTLINPLSFWGDKNVRMFEHKFLQLFPTGFMAKSVDSGRSALYLILKSLGITKGDEVIIQAFTCIVVPNAVKKIGAALKYVDIDDTYNLDPIVLEKEITSKTKAVLIQHTFGIPAKVKDIKAVIDKAQKRYGKRIYLIEDCAHSLGLKHESRIAGEWGDAAFFSFGRDKIISSVFGGMILTQNSDIFKKVSKIHQNLPTPNIIWQIRQILHPILFGLFILPFYNFGYRKLTLGKFVLYFLQRSRLLTFPVSEGEKEGVMGNMRPAKMPNSLAKLAILQLGKLGAFNSHRKKIAAVYKDNIPDNSNINLPSFVKGAIWLRYPVRMEKPGELSAFLKKNGVVVGDWYKDIVQPSKRLELVQYKWGSCPRAEEYAKSILNLPTYPTFSFNDANLVIGLIKKWKN